MHDAGRSGDSAAALFEAVLFDLDGVLIDSSELVISHWREFAGWYGLPPDEVLRDVHGRRAVDIISQHLAGRSQAELAEAISRHEQLETADTAGVIALPGADQILKALPPERWAIVTACTTEVARCRLRAVHLPVPATLVASEDVAAGKPAPDGYLAAASRLGADPRRCLVIEDAPHGLAAGRAAGAAVLAVATTHAVAELGDADLIVPDLTAVEFRSAGADLRLSASVPDDWPAR